jgi:hypothetical protein
VSVRRIRIDDPADGEWVMARLGGVYCRERDHVIAQLRDERIAGGMVYTTFLGGAIAMHVAGVEDNWPTRDWLWMIFDFPFRQLGVRKVLGPVEASNARALKIDKQLGFREVTRLPDVMADGGDLIILEMTRAEWEAGRWSKIVPRYYRSNQKV